MEIYSIAETIQFGFGFAFGGFDHHGSGNRPGHCRSMKSIVHEALGNIFDLNSGGLFELLRSTTHSCATNPFFPL